MHRGPRRTTPKVRDGRVQRKNRAAHLDRLGVPARKGPGCYELRFTEGTARAYQLLHIFLHELGHHYDRMTTRSKRTSRGEPYAESYATKHAETVWDRYLAEFGLD